MGLLHVLYVIFIWPLFLLLRGVTRPFVAIGQLLCWFLYHRKRRGSTLITGQPVPAEYGDHLKHHASSSSSDNIFLPGGGLGQSSGSGGHGFGFKDGLGEDHLKFRNRQGFKTDDQQHPLLRGGGSLLPSPLRAPSSVTPKDLPPPVPFYYAINVPPRALEGAESVQLVFQEKGIWLKEIKKYKGARFKAFPTEQEAINYTNYVPEVVTTPLRNPGQTEDTAGNSPHPAMLEKSNWKAPKGPDLLKLRRSIESGDFETVQDMISSNPRFLISCGDTPSILQEGPRYNALHFAAKNNRPEVVKLWFQTIEHPSFFQKLYGLAQENEDARKVRVQKLLDLYLNTPDKGPCETPLHFACKFGHKDVVEVLMSHPLTEPHPRNKFGETPADLICQRVDKPSKQTEKEIRDYLEGRRYVPLYRAEDNMVSPTVGTPCSPIFRADIFSPPFSVSQMNPFSPEFSPASPKSPHDPQAVMKAFAGPMSPSEADQFRKMWRSPCSRNEQSKVVREDHEKGYERLGRDLAVQNNVPWSEYWEFLDRFTDLSKPEGIGLLESFLQNQSLALNVQNSLEAIQRSANNSPSLRHLAPATHRLHSMKKALFSDGGDDENGPDDIANHDDITFGGSSLGSSPPPPPPPSTTALVFPNYIPTQPEEMDVSPPPPLANGTMPYNQTGSPEDQQPEKELSFREENLEEIMSTLARDFGTKLCIMSPANPSDNNGLPSTEDETPDNFEITEQEVNPKMNCLFPLRGEFTDMLSAVQNQEPLSVSFTTTQESSCDKKPTPSSCLSPQASASSPKSSTIAGTVLLNIKSPNKLIAQISGMPARSPPKLRNPLKVFIQGSVPTKLDRDVLRCLTNVPVDNQQFPYTAKWLGLINSFSEIEQKIWPSPAKGHGREPMFKDGGTPFMRAPRAVSRLEPMALFKSPSTAT